jgi:hypothetical protein
MSDQRGWRRFVPAFSLRTLLELVFVCGVLFYVGFNRPPVNVIRPDHVLQVEADGTLPDAPIRGAYLVDPDGCVNLGAVYGKVKVSGMTADEAQVEVLGRLQTTLASPHVVVSIAGWRDSWELGRVDALEKEIEELRMEMRSYEWKRKGLSDPQNSTESIRDR